MADQPNILLEHDGLIVVNKAAGVPTAGDTLEQPGSVQYELMQRYRRKIWAVHQLDRDTSGLNLFVRRKALVQEWVERLKNGTKTYLAVCERRFAGVTIDEPIGWVAHGRRGVTTSGKPARTSFVPLAQTDDATLVEATLHTGRTHQIRIHAAHAGHPVVGDARYGNASGLIARQALHAFRIVTDAGELEAPPPDDFAALLEALKLES